MATQFLEYVDRKQRDSRRHLSLVEKLLRKNGMNVAKYLDDDDPYIFLHSPNQKLTFEGIRIYTIGDTMAYRVQKEEKTHPYGKAYMLNLEEMFNDLMSENMKEEEAGHKVIEGVVYELKKFFNRSAEAEDELKNKDVTGSGQIQLRTGGTDYSALVYNKL
jgi:hypothetical protein